MLDSSGNVGVGTTSPSSKLQVDGEIDANGGDRYSINGRPWAAESSSYLKLGDWDGTFRYRTSGNNSYVDMCMQTGASTYAWVNIVTNSW